MTSVLAGNSMEIPSHLTDPNMPSESVNDNTPPENVDNKVQISSDRQTIKEEEKTMLLDFIETPRPSLFGKQASKKAIFTWSLKALKQSLTDVDEEYEERVLKCFRDIQRVMGDRKYGRGKKALGNRPRSLDYESIQRNIDLGLQFRTIRDELYLQVMKQINGNPKTSSKVRGWEILCAYSTTIPPTKELIPVLLKELERYNVHMTSEEKAEAMSSEASTDKRIIDLRISLMCTFIKSGLEKLSRTGPRGHLPTTEEIDNTLGSPFRTRIFGGTFQEIMEEDSARDECGLFPKILTFLAESILLLKGTESEGIFRVPGFIDEIQMLRLRIEKGNYSIEGIKDPSTPASLLKMWLRELAEPVIPDEFYDRCLKVGTEVDVAMEILDEIPEINSNVLKYLIKFLQVVGDPRYQAKTKMTVSNLAMVFAPNILRCPSDNPLVILAHSTAQQAFLKTLINYLED